MTPDGDSEPDRQRVELIRMAKEFKRPGGIGYCQCHPVARPSWPCEYPPNDEHLARTNMFAAVRKFLPRVPRTNLFVRATSFR